MESKYKLYVLHEYGAKNHYLGLINYCVEKKIDLEFKEFVCLKPIFLNISKRRFSDIRRHLNNLFFLITLFFSNGKTIILGGAPYDWRMIFFLFLSKKHKFYYHTSWIKWDGTSFPKETSSKYLNYISKKKWRIFFENHCLGIFAVTNEVKKEIINNYKINCQISVVYHSVNQVFTKNYTKRDKPEKLKILFVGRLVKEKGIKELLKLADRINKEKFHIGIVGEGNYLKNEIIKKSDNFELTYYGRVDKEELVNIYNNYDILICPSKKIKDVAWEELFGMVIIEAMSCGLIPIVTNHKGPIEIISANKNGFIIEDNSNMVNSLHRKLLFIKQLSNHDYNTLKENAVKKGMMFCKENIKYKWAEILNTN